MSPDGADPAALLDAVHAALRGGEFSALASLTSALEALASGDLPRDPQGLARMRGRLERNAACLQASARGLRAARRRMAEIVAARTGLQTYTRSGQMQRIGPVGPTLAQRV